MSAVPSDTPAVSSPAAGGQTNHGCLPRGYRLREFVIERVLGDGGFGVVYSALDLRLERRVAIKEYMPSALATRNTDYSVQMLTSKRHRDAFEVGLRSFINEARLLARFEHPALIKVHQFWQEKGTAYMVMPFYSAPTLRTWVRARSEPAGEAWLRHFLLAAMDALEVMHAESCLHRDIAPDNILVLKDTAPLLLDFGAARRVIGDLRKALTVIVKPGFAPLEQYADTVKMKQGPWTDVYALAAVAHYVLTGQPPAPAVSRIMHDEVVPLRMRLKGKYSDALLGALDTALAVKPERRPQTIAAFRSLLLSQQPGEWEPTRLIRRAPPGSTTHRAIELATAEGELAAAKTASREPEAVESPSVAPTTVQRTAANAPKLDATTAQNTPLTLRTRLRSADRTLPRFPDVGTLTQVVRESIPPSVQESRWLGVAGYAAAILACGGVLALTAHLVETYLLDQARPMVAATATTSQSEPARAPAKVAAELPPTRFNGGGAMVEAKPTEVTLAPAKIDPPSVVPVVPAAAKPQSPAPAPAKPKAAPPAPAKPKAASPAKTSASERKVTYETNPGALLLTSAAPAPAAAAAPAPAPAKPTPGVVAKTRGLDDFVVPLERAAEVAQVAPVEIVVTQPPPAPAAVAPTAAAVSSAAPPPLRPIDRPQPQFPAAAAKEGVRNGRVLAQITVNADGSVGGIDIVDAHPNRVFDREVRRALSNWRYEAPGQPRQTTVEFLFKLEQ